MKTAISVTLKEDNVSWLKGRARTAGLRSVSELIDRLVSQARTSGHDGTRRSVVGTVDIEPSDPLLKEADEAIRAMFDASLARPSRVKEQSDAYGGQPAKAITPARKRPPRG